VASWPEPTAFAAIFAVLIAPSVIFGAVTVSSAS
jgi:hypothetical protein